MHLDRLLDQGAREVGLGHLAADAALHVASAAAGTLLHPGQLQQSHLQATGGMVAPRPLTTSSLGNNSQPLLSSRIRRRRRRKQQQQGSPLAPFPDLSPFLLSLAIPAPPVRIYSPRGEMELFLHSDRGILCHRLCGLVTPRACIETTARQQWATAELLESKTRLQLISSNPHHPSTEEIARDEMERQAEAEKTATMQAGANAKKGSASFAAAASSQTQSLLNLHPHRRIPPPPLPPLRQCPFVR